MLGRILDSRPARAARLRWPLLAVAAVEVLLFVAHHYEWWRHRAGPDRPGTLRGEGMVIRGDGLGYYAWLRSPLIDGDWSFDNEFDEHNLFADKLTGPAARTDLGLRVNPWSVGPALAWAPAVVLTHLALLAHLPGTAAWPADGYSLPYQLAVGLTTLGLSLLGLALLYGICRRYAGPRRAAWAAAFLFLGSTIVYYSTVEVAMAHGVGAAAMAGLVWYWLRTYGSPAWRRWLVVGALVGLTALVRWQLATFAVLPAGECALLSWRDGRQGRFREAAGRALGLFLAGAASLVVFLPQLVAWHSVFGHWLVMPQEVEHHWASPSVGHILLSQDRGLFYWTPVTLLACVGYLAYFLRRRCGEAAAPGDGPPALLLVGFALQLYVLGSLWGVDVVLGYSYGFRYLTESVVVLAPGLALLLGRAPERRLRPLWALGCLLVVWNLLLIGQFCYRLVPRDGGADPVTLVANVRHLFRR